VLDERSFASFAVKAMGKFWYVGVTLTLGGKVGWARETAQNAGTRALVIVDGDAVAELDVVGPVRDGILQIFTDSQDKATALAAQLSAICP
jgi:hypothetical protein